MSEGTMLTRDEARRAFAETGLASKDLHLDHIYQLALSMDKALQDAGSSIAIKAKFRSVRDGETCVHQITCGSDWFTDREAVTFNPNGFVGFAGWADDDNVQPFLRGFMAWVEGLTSTCEPTPDSP